VSGLTKSQVAVVGLGLMGGSLAGALRDRCRAVIGVTRRQETAEIAVTRGLVDWATLDLAEGLAEAGVVVLATPVRVILRLLGEIGPLVPDGCLVIDLGSTKKQIVARMAQLPEGVQPLGGHPMCGKEASGIEVSDPALYQGQTFVLTPLQRTSGEALQLGAALVEALGARPLFLDAECHDRLVAAISHLPYLLACSLVGVAGELAAADGRVWDVAASGFRDTSRLAASDVTMMTDILLTNPRAVREALAACTARLRELDALIDDGDEAGLRAALSAACERRRGVYPCNG